MIPPTEQEYMDIMQYAMHSALLMQFLTINWEHPNMDKDYLSGAVHSLEQATPNILLGYLAEWIDTPEGRDWMVRMGLGPFSAFKQQIDLDEGQKDA